MAGQIQTLPLNLITSHLTHQILNWVDPFDLRELSTEDTVENYILSLHLSTYHQPVHKARLRSRTSTSPLNPTNPDDEPIWTNHPHQSAILTFLYLSSQPHLTITFNLDERETKSEGARRLLKDFNVDAAIMLVIRLRSLHTSSHQFEDYLNVIYIFTFCPIHPSSERFKTWRKQNRGGGRVSVLMYAGCFWSLQSCVI